MAQPARRREQQEDEEQREADVHVAQRRRRHDAVGGVQVIDAHRHRDGEQEVAPGAGKAVMRALFGGDELLGLLELLLGDDRLHADHFSVMPRSAKYLIAPG